jgi:hypothetical protein
MNADGSGQKRLIKRTTVSGDSHRSPDGTQIVLSPRTALHQRIKLKSKGVLGVANKSKASFLLR